MEKVSDNQHTDTQPPTPKSLTTTEGQGYLHFLHWQCNISGYKVERDNDSQQGDFFKAGQKITDKVDR